MFVLFKTRELCKHSQIYQNSRVQERGGMLLSQQCYLQSCQAVILLAEILSMRSSLGYLRLLAQVLLPLSFLEISSHQWDNARLGLVVTARK